MMKKDKGFLLVLFVGLLFYPFEPAHAETIELVTYYPTSGSGGNGHFTSLTVGTPYLAQNPADGTAIVSGLLGIGTTAPVAPLHVEQAGGSGLVAQLIRYASDLVPTILQLTHARGTAAAPTALQSTDQLGLIRFRGAGSSTQFSDGATVAAIAAENWSATTAATDLIFSTTPTGSIGSAERMRIRSDGRVLIGTAALPANMPTVMLAARRDANEGVAIRIENTTSDTAASARLFAVSQLTVPSTPISIGIDAYSQGFSTTSGMGDLVPGNTAISTFATFGTMPATLGNLFIASRGPNQRIGFHTGSLTINAASERMRIDNTGNVGIGTAAPAEKLDVAGDLIVRNPTTPTNYVRIRARSDASTGIELHGVSPAGTPYIDFSSAEVDYDARIKLTGSDSLNIEGARLGIGEPIPQVALHVNGQVRVHHANQPELWFREGDVEAAHRQWKFFADGAKFWGGTTNDTNTSFLSWVEVSHLQAGSHSIGLVSFPAGFFSIGTANYPPVISGSNRLKFYVEGTAGKAGSGTTWNTFSDARLKKEIQPLEGALGKMLQLRGVTFKYKEPEKLRTYAGRQMGLIGQEVEKAFPEWITKEGPDGIRLLSYVGFEPLTVESIRELKQQNDQLRTRLEAQEKELQLLKKQMEGAGQRL